jgi:predicted phage terminase large subunit-like protein
MYSADAPDLLRGPQFDLAICDELAAWRYPEALDMLLLGLRIGKNPRVAIATTPRPTKIIRDLIAREGKDVVLTRGSTLENKSNLAPAYIEQIIDRYKGTRLERQEVFGELLDDVPGALWNRDVLEATRVEQAPKDLQRIVIGVDPAGSSEENADMTGIVVAGLGQDGHGYVLDDLSGRYTPTEWARRALGAFHVWKADKIVVERNFGGEMCAATLAAVDASVPVKTISSSRGKVLRAEPIAAMFEQHRAHIVGSQPELEDQMCRFTSDWSRERDGSPDRIDAAVFALTELMLGHPTGGYIPEAALLTQPRENEPRAPEGVPAVVNAVYASLAAAVGPDGPVAGVIYFAVMGLGGEHEGQRRAFILDWDLVEVNPLMLSAWPEAVFTRSVELATGRAMAGTDCMMLLDADGLGQIVLDALPLGRRFECLLKEEWGDLTERVITAAGLVTSGRVHICPPAYEKIVSFKGIAKNHLLGQVTAFGLSEETAVTGPLLVAFTNGVIPIFTEKKSPHAVTNIRRR